MLAGTGLLFMLKRTLAKWVLTSGVLLIAIGLFYYFTPPVFAIKDASSPTRPNIIIIGVDAVRPDFLSFFAHTQKTKTEHFDDFLRQATVFSDAITPIARTFPSWASILTGKYPVHNGIRFDLADLKGMRLITLPVILQRYGYESIYATDETRFSNIDQQFGFDHVISPPVGLNDFLLGTLNDFPLSNFVVNTFLGRWLFPYSYANRPAYTTYDPDSFLKLLQPALQKSREKPLFLAIHFCLPHFPYFWASYSYRDTTRALPHYRAAIARMDKQFSDFMRLLAREGLLKHSIVVLLSDHGEALELIGDRMTEEKLFMPGLANKKKIIPHFYPQAMEDEKVNQSAGHGTDVLSSTQYRSLLALRTYGTEMAAKAQVVNGLASLLDVKATLLDWLDIPNASDEGMTLRPYMTHPDRHITRSDFFIESDFSPQAIRTTHPEMRQVLFAGVDLFKIDAVTRRITFKKSMADLIISSKQVADIDGHWILALYPQKNSAMIPILVNTQTGQWTNDLTIPFARQAPLRHMELALRRFFAISPQWVRVNTI